MDRIYNNEALLSIVILRLLDFGPSDVSRMLLFSTVLMDDTSRSRLNKSVSSDDFFLKMRHTIKSFNRKFRETTVIFLNTIQMLKQAGSIDYKERDFLLHKLAAIYTSDINSNRLAEILSSAQKMHEILKNISIEILFSQLRIQL